MFAEPQIFNGAFAIRLDDISSLVLQEEPLSLVIECLLVDIMHLLSLYQGDNVKISSQFALAFYEQLSSLLCVFETLRAPFFNQFLSTTAK